MSDASTAQSDRLTLPRFLGGVTGLILVVSAVLLVGMLRGPIVDGENTQSSTRQPSQQLVWSPQVQGRAIPTAHYWNLAVVPLHRLRSEDPSGSHEKGMALMQRIVVQFEQAIALARAAPTRDVDPELVTMVSQHVAIDEILLGRIKELIQIVDDPAQSPAAVRDAYQHLTASELNALAEQITQRDDLPPAAKEYLRQLAEAQEATDKVLLDTEIMQAKLQERYHSVRSYFTLPTSGAESLQLSTP